MLNYCKLYYNSGVEYNNCFLIENLPFRVQVSYWVPVSSRVTLLKVFLQVADNSEFNDVTSILLDYASGGTGYLTEPLEGIKDLESANLSAFYSNTDSLYVRLAIYETVYDKEYSRYEGPVTLNKLDISHYYTGAEWKRGEMLVYSAINGWTPAVVKGKLTKAINASGDTLTDINNNTLYIVEKENL